MIEREDLVLEPLPDDGMDDLASTLREAELPHQDLAGKSKRFFCASVSGEIVGYVGLEISGPDALLRSASPKPSLAKKPGAEVVSSHTRSIP